MPDLAENGGPPGARVSLVSGLRRLAAKRPGGPANPAAATAELCDFCRTGLPPEHTHLLDVQERRILCVCQTCTVRQSGEARYVPVGRRLWRLTGFKLPEEIWARFQIPVGLAFFFLSSAANQVIALYPSPLGATESQLDLEAWEDLRRENMVLASLEPDAEALLVRKNNAVYEVYLAPIDECYRLVGLLKTTWQGISGGALAEAGIEAYFAELRSRAKAA
ncbi:MAG TPA: DUF5947 family protein [Thermoanaerobaculia bacterium]|nr:DUF5947 family protein [Thermoanaerobaculia bacterium]